MKPNEAVSKLLDDNDMSKVRLSSLMGKSYQYVGKTLCSKGSMNISTLLNMLSKIGDGYEPAIQKSDKRIKRGEQIILDDGGKK